jgi:hypothetical protein
MDFLTEPPFGTDAHAVADDQHPQHQVGIDRGPADSAVERPQLCTDALQINKPVDAAKQMIPWHIIIEAEIIEQLRRRDLHAHHRLSLLLQNTESAHRSLHKREFINTIGAKRTAGSGRTRNGSFWPRKCGSGPSPETGTLSI